MNNVKIGDYVYEAFRPQNPGKVIAVEKQNETKVK